MLEWPLNIEGGLRIESITSRGHREEARQLAGQLKRSWHDDKETEWITEIKGMENLWSSLLHLENL